MRRISERGGGAVLPIHRNQRRCSRALAILGAVEGGVEGHNVGINVHAAHGSRRLRGSLSPKFCVIGKSFAVPFAA